MYPAVVGGGGNKAITLNKLIGIELHKGKRTFMFGNTAKDCINLIFIRFS